MTVGRSTANLHHDLQAVLGQLYDLHVQAVEAHAHFVGTRFYGMQQQLEAIVQVARDAGNAVAECVREFDGDTSRRLILTETPPAIPGLRPGERCTTAATNMITRRTALVLNTIRCACAELRGVDASVTDLLREIADTVEKQALLLSSESRRIGSRSE
jgi:starvation-inducible DNA-binding protein